MAFDEASYLYKTIKTIKAGKFAEVGRFKGGSTFLIAAAMDESSTLDSYDIHLISYLVDSKNSKELVNGSVLDNELIKILKQFDLNDRVNLIVENSNNARLTNEYYDLVIIDGDHSYDGVKKDFLHWKSSLKRNGHIFFHDAVKTRPFSSANPGSIKLMNEIKSNYNNEFTLKKEIGTLIHFQKTK